MEGNNDPSPPPTEDDPPSARPGEAGLDHRWMNCTVVFLLDTIVKAVSVLFWFMIFAPFFNACGK